jgi:hypothetical protein
MVVIMVVMVVMVIVGQRTGGRREDVKLNRSIISGIGRVGRVGRVVEVAVVAEATRGQGRTEGGVHGQQLAAQASGAGALQTAGGWVKAGQSGGGAIQAGQGGRVFAQQHVASSQVKQRLSRPPAIV